MGKYTQSDDPRIESAIAEALQTVTSLVAERFDPEAILLAGSFGRSEGSAVVVDERVKFLKDFDVVVIVDRSPSQSALENVTTEIHRALGIDDPSGRAFRFSGF